jgi:hypothetical protein
MQNVMLIISMAYLAFPAYAEDARLPELLHLIAASEACRIDPNPAGLRFMSSLRDRLDEVAAKVAYKQMQADVEEEIVAKGPVTVCLTAWEKMKAEGFL